MSAHEGAFALLAGAALLWALAAFVTLHPRRTPASVAFGVALVGFGTWAGCVALGRLLGIVDLAAAPWERAPAWLLAARTTAALVGLAGFVALASRFPEPLDGRGRRDALAALALLAANAAAYVTVEGGLGAAYEGASLGVFLLHAANTLSSGLILGSFGAIVLFYTLGYRRARPERRRDHLLLVAGLMLVQGLQNGFAIRRFVMGEPVAAAATVAAVEVLVVAGLWLAWTSIHDASRGPRNLALLALASPLLAVVASGVAGGFPAAYVGAVLAGGGAVFAYAVLRHQLLGLDVTVRWTLSRTTVAAVFVAVFFVASEAAQEFFGTALGGAYVGILAAGALVFALAPLQRLGDALAERAVPRAPTAGVASPSREDVYRTMARYVLADRVVTRAEERALARLADELGIGAARALELREEAEAEARRAPSQPRG